MGTVGAVDREDSIEVVNLVLEQLGHVTLELDFVGVALGVLVADPDAPGPLYPDQQVGIGEAVIPDREIVAADLRDFGIDQHPGTRHLTVDDPERRADLGRGERASGTEPGLGVAERLPEVVHDHADGKGARLGDGLAAGPEDRVAEESDSVDGHSIKSDIPGSRERGGAGGQTADDRLDVDGNSVIYD